ncbi:unnamed protein product [Paramecium sonneborni]|uniref:Ubiquitin-activating enzyme E1 C-terminal domain-containing protein n=1 Tax=Paramecium sonneborni TaxID=65129 RepID=A0A8S1RS49_9CILI|nr:unnamed protein product [Paramecium sonneborni]
MNGHIDFIHFLGNLRALNYDLDEMDWITVKLKAGRIVPALATTTAVVVSGLQTIELVKVLKKCKLENMKKGFINLGVPIVQLNDQIKAETIKLNEDANVTLWDRWEVKLGKDFTLESLFYNLKQTYHLEPSNVFKQSSVIYMHDLHKGQTLFTQPIIELLDVKTDYVDLVINFIKDKQILKNVPEVRLRKGLPKFIYDVTMKVIGRIINKMEKKDQSMGKEMFMREIGKMIKPMFMEIYIYHLIRANQLLQMVDIIQVNGSRINKMDKEKNIGQMEQILKEIMLMVSNLVKEYMQLQMILNIFENLLIILFVVVEYLNALMKLNIQNIRNQIK